MTQKKVTRFDLEKHLAEEHKMSSFSTYLREIVYGGNDGIITTFAVVAGFAGAHAQGNASLPLMAVLLFGFANLFADGASMALGNFLSTRSEQDVYAGIKAKEMHEIDHNPSIEKEESIEILIRKGFSEKQAEQLVSIYMTNKPYWTSFMMNEELELPNPEGERPVHMALATFFSFVLFGCIPLLPYIFFTGHPSLFLMSVVSTGFAMLLLGILRWRVTMQSMWRSIGENLALGIAAASIAYLVGTMFRV